MPGYRAERIAEMVHRELDERLRLQVKDPRVTPISITDVTVSGDLRRAEVRYMPLGGGDVSDELKDGLAEAARKLRGAIGRALRLRNAPEIVFLVDTNTEDAIRITHLLDSLARKRAEGQEE